MKNLFTTLTFALLVCLGCKQRHSLGDSQSSPEGSSDHTELGPLQCSGDLCQRASKDTTVRAFAEILDGDATEGHGMALTSDPAAMTPEQRMDALMKRVAELKRRQAEILTSNPNAKIKVMECSRTIVQSIRDVYRRDPKTGDPGNQFTGTYTMRSWRARFFIIFQSYPELVVRERCQYLFERDPAIAKIYPTSDPPYDIVTYKGKNDYDFKVTEQEIDASVKSIEEKLRAETGKEDVVTLRIDPYYSVNWTFLYSELKSNTLYRTKWEKASSGCQKHGYKVASIAELNVIRPEVESYLDKNHHPNVPAEDRPFWVEGAREPGGEFFKGDKFWIYYSNSGKTWVHHVGTFSGNPTAFVICMYLAPAE